MLWLEGGAVEVFGKQIQMKHHRHSTAERLFCFSNIFRILFVLVAVSYFPDCSPDKAKGMWKIWGFLKQIPLVQLEVVWIFCPSSGGSLRAQAKPAVLNMQCCRVRNKSPGGIWGADRSLQGGCSSLQHVEPCAVTAGQADPAQHESSSPVPRLKPTLATWMCSTWYRGQVIKQLRVFSGSECWLIATGCCCYYLSKMRL